MKDFNGEELREGNDVIFLYKPSYSSDSYLKRARVLEITKKKRIGKKNAVPENFIILKVEGMPGTTGTWDSEGRLVKTKI